ncbi:MAG: type I methionyl aminopeptidase [Gemmatimonadota bacterium]
MIHLKSAREIEHMAAGGAIIGELFHELAPQVEPGVSTGELDAFAEEFIRSHEGAVPLFKGLYGFPGTVCASVNEEVVHGIPSATRRLKEGDLLTLDVGVRWEGWCADSARTFPVGQLSVADGKLLEATSESLKLAVDAAVPGNHVGDLGAAVEARVEGTGFSVIRDLVGHGVGRELHEEPQIPNLGKPGRGPRLLAGMVIAIEPMISAGTFRIKTLEDGWTVVTADGSRSAHFEHTVAVTEDGPRILTASRHAASAAN